MRLILGGHHRQVEPGWTVLEEADQDIRQRLAFPDDSIEVIFTEHVIEHVPFVDGVHFLSEAHRVLRKGGVFRCVSPMIERLVTAFLDAPDGVTYLQELERALPDETARLRAFGFHLDAVDARPFLWDAIMRQYGHRFLWSEELMIQFCLRIGFTRAYRAAPGCSHYDPSICRERPSRPPRTRWGFDPESGVVEAIK